MRGVMVLWDEQQRSCRETRAAEAGAHRCSPPEFSVASRRAAWNSHTLQREKCYVFCLTAESTG